MDKKREGRAEVGEGSIQLTFYIVHVLVVPIGLVSISSPSRHLLKTSLLLSSLLFSPSLIFPSLPFSSLPFSSLSPAIIAKLMDIRYIKKHRIEKSTLICQRLKNEP